MIDVSACPGTEPALRPAAYLVRVGREIGQLDLDGTGDPSIAPGSDYATSVATGRGAGRLPVHAAVRHAGCTSARPTAAR